MCCQEKSGCCCQFPEKLKDRPEDCSEEQIKECHGETGSHQCTQEKEVSK